MRAFDTPTVDAVVQLRDGRTLAYAEFGRPVGIPVFHFHGGGTTRLEAALLAEAAAKLGVRLIGLDLPGIGRSQVRQGYRLLDWPDDVVQVAEALGIERFAVEGVSAGAPFALACAYKIPNRLLACGLISGMVPLNLVTATTPLGFRATWFITQRFSWLLRLTSELSNRAYRDEATIEKLLLRSTWFLPEPEKKVLRNPHMRKLLARAALETTWQGVATSLYGAKLLTDPWGFALEQVTFEKLFLWHGQLDESVPVSLAQAMADRFAHCTATIYPNEAHISTLVNHTEDILAALVSA
jgi:pimeloyl-ACP methyl ester carboxylesterase